MKKVKSSWTILRNLKGDRVVGIIVLLLIVISILAVFSSTSLLAIQQDTSRIAILKEQLVTVGMGISIMLIIYLIPSIGYLRFLSQFGFLLSVILLSILFFHLNLGFAKAIKINEAWRSIQIGGKQLHVFEFVKIIMILYLAWAVDAFKQGKLTLANLLSKKYKILKNKEVQKFIYIYIPILLVCVLIIGGSFSSAIFSGATMLLTILICGIDIKSLFKIGTVGVLLISLCIYIDIQHFDGKLFPHATSAIERVKMTPNKYVDVFLNSKQGSKEWSYALDKLRQPISAKIAIHDGKLLGKGPGCSTQRYVVPVMFEDYMFSFLLEEYGLFGILGGLIIIILYGSLLARGSIIARNCNSIYAKTSVAGLTLLITGQALMHMYINVGIGPLTGQTLPMISHGNSSFLAFSIAFGVILSISKMTNEKIKRQEEEAIKMRQRNDEIHAGLEMLDDFEIEN